MSYEEETADFRARIRELEQALDEAPSRDRLRELEADYRHENEGRRAIEALWTEQKARAEKGEARIRELEAELAKLRGVNAECNRLVNRAEKAEKLYLIAEKENGQLRARVAELLQELCDHGDCHHEANPI